jgi:hypothetical protein
VLRHLGRYGEALVDNQEAVRLLRNLADEQPECAAFPNHPKTGSSIPERGNGVTGEPPDLAKRARNPAKSPFSYLCPSSCLNCLVRFIMV